jgi:hypothetical protein
MSHSLTFPRLKYINNMADVLKKTGTAYPSQAPVFTLCFNLHKHLCSPSVLPFTSTCVHPLFLVRSMLLIFIVFCCCWFFFVLCSILPVSLDCPFWIVPSVFSYVDLLLICNNFLKQKVRSFM